MKLITLTALLFMPLALTACGSKMTDEEARSTYKITEAEDRYFSHCVMNANAAGISIAADKSNSENCGCFIRELSKRNLNGKQIGATVDLLGVLMRDKAQRGKDGGGPGDALSKALVAEEQRLGIEHSEGTRLLNIGMQSSIACK